MATTGTLFALGDILAQTLGPSKETADATPAQTLDRGDSPPTDNPLARTARAATYGTLYAPLGDAWYRLLQRRVAGTLLRVAADQLLFAPAGLALYYAAMAVLRGEPPATAAQRVRAELWPTLCANWCVWPWVQLVNFRWVPVEYRLGAVSGVAVLWNAYLSMRNAASCEQRA
ncbi:hypothetical protein DAKH74_011030 [Maudiozyma humilis]|uniref:Protein SYM1 n=1 Tax=Maudiozyma humilis TaxID=51915 RepID=A0AAV5RUW6_MAUHU|nr:hypothetical protein DAKH74_011030 [Kazachstania humilis]